MTYANQDGRPPNAKLSDATASALLSVLESGEGVERIVPAVGCTIVLTKRRLLLVRERAQHRPRTGIRSWPIDQQLRLELDVGLGETTRLSISREGQAASVFLRTMRIREVRSLVAAVRRQTGAT
jgi:hypothetical protein